MRQYMVVIVQHLFQCRGKPCRVSQVAQSKRPSCGFILIAGADATPGRANFIFTPSRLTRLIQRHVIGQYERAGRGDLQPILHGYTAFLQGVDLFQ